MQEVVGSIPSSSTKINNLARTATLIATYRKDGGATAAPAMLVPQASCTYRRLWVIAACSSLPNVASDPARSFLKLSHSER